MGRGRSHGTLFPKLADQPSAAAFNPDFGATNFRDRWLLAASYALSKQLNPQFLIHGEAGQSPQIGLNLTTLVNDATVAYVEYSGGRSSSLLAQAQMPAPASAFRSRLAAGATYTTANNLSLTIEYEYNGAGLDRAAWDALRSGSPAVYAQYRILAAELQELPTKQRVFAYARWQDAMINHLDFAAFAYYDLSTPVGRPGSKRAITGRNSIWRCSGRSTAARPAANMERSRPGKTGRRW